MTVHFHYIYIACKAAFRDRHQLGKTQVRKKMFKNTSLDAAVLSKAKTGVLTKKGFKQKSLYLFPEPVSKVTH